MFKFSIQTISQRLLIQIFVQDEVDDNFYSINKLYKFDTLNIPGFRNGQDIKKVKHCTNHCNKLGVFKMVLKNVPSLL